MISKRYISFINLFLAIALVLTSGYLVWSLYRSRPEPADGYVEYVFDTSKLPAPTPVERDYYQVIVSRSLWETKFEAPEDRPPPTPIPPKKPPPKIRLAGTSVSVDPSRSRAIIEDLTSRTQKIYQIGDEIRGAEILEIHRNRVVLDHQGERFVISSFEGSLPVPKVHLSLSRILRRIGKNKWLVSRKGLWELVNAGFLETMLRTDFFKISVGDVIGALSTVGCRPYYPSGRRHRGDSEGYEIVVLPKKHLASQLGINEGDIIRTVNGEMITGKKHAIKLLQDVQNEKEVVVEVSRGEKLIELQYLIQEDLLEPVEGEESSESFQENEEETAPGE